MRVAIVDSPSEIRVFLVGLVERAGFEAESFDDGSQLVAAIRGDLPPRIALVRFDRSGIAAEALCRQLRALGSASPWLVGLVDRGHHEEGLAGVVAGWVDDLMVVPVDSEAIAIRLAVARRSVALRERVERAENALVAEATRDAITGLWNRSATLSFLGRELAQCRRGGGSVGLARVLVLDIASFDLTGASAIERLVADALRTAVRVSDWAGRLGEGSFLVVLPSCGLERAGVIAERIFRLASQRLEGSGVFAAVQIAVDAEAVGPEAPPAEELVARLVAGDR